MFLAVLCQSQLPKARLIADKKEARREKFDKLKANIKEKFSKKN